jgi:hypothetical protein
VIQTHLIGLSGPRGWIRNHIAYPSARCDSWLLLVAQMCRTGGPGTRSLKYVLLLSISSSHLSPLFVLQVPSLSMRDWTSKWGKILAKKWWWLSSLWSAPKTLLPSTILRIDQNHLRCLLHAGFTRRSACQPFSYVVLHSRFPFSIGRIPRTC